ncbi:NepR family anti-sigma factor [Sphingomonas solaris]|uniref:Anti-sigma factor NepR domain-containing protein n=1 Tax=Alterirhizorhabdus solaris TaxID=2529389 RepID=A0A558QZV8_9SPHN|nr:NepR family anti-sigma factor [Sphingomonas solaris]TVV72639.1 hypothetical protein FOY91_14025 [Sphingomonas solaris]
MGERRIRRADVSVDCREGNIELGAKDDRKGQADAAAPRKSAIREDVAGGNVGNALRTVYDQTVNEDIPGEMLDLLGKLA